MTKTLPKKKKTANKIKVKRKKRTENSRKEEWKIEGSGGWEVT